MLVAVIPAILAALLFAPSARYGFVFDDIPIIEENDRIDDPTDFAAIFGTSYWGDESPGTRLWRPLALWTFAIDRVLWGPGPFGPHLTNILLHALATALVGLLVLRVYGRAGPALIAGAIFAVHPIHVEVVANGVGRAELGAALGALGAILLHLRGFALADEDAPRGPRIRAHLAALLCLFVGLLFKESAVMAPALALVCVALGPGAGAEGLRAARRRLPPLLLAAVPVAIYLVLRFRIVPPAALAPPEVAFGAAWWQRLGSAVEVLLRTGGQLLLPLRLAAQYDDYAAPLRELPAWRALLAIVGAALVVVAALLARRRGAPAALLALAFFVVALLPVSNLLVPIGTLRGDRLLYLPSIAVALLAAAGVLRFGTSARRATILIAMIAIAAGTLRTALRLPAWRSQAALTEATVRDAPNNAAAWAMLGAQREAAGDLAGAEEAWATAVALFARGGHRGGVEAAVLHAQAAGRRGDLDEAERRYRALLERVPDAGPALLDLGALRFERGDRAEGLDLLARAVAADPGNPLAHVNLVRALRIDGRRDEAAAALREARAAHPDDPLVQALGSADR